MSMSWSISPSPCGCSAAAGRWRAPLAALLLAGLSACAGPLDDPGRFVYLLSDGGAVDDGGDGRDAGADGGQSDAGTADAGDAGPSDAGATDAGASDAGAGDAGHPDGGTHDGGIPDAGCNPVVALFGPTCATGLCHGADTQQGHLDLESPGMPGRLVGLAGFGGPGLIIDPAHPDSSLMLTKLTTDPPFNFQMPLGLDPLTASETACIRDWVHRAVGQ